MMRNLIAVKNTEFYDEKCDRNYRFFILAICFWATGKRKIVERIIPVPTQKPGVSLLISLNKIKAKMMP